MRVVVLGAWHLGAVAAAVNADWGRDVTVWDRDVVTREALRRRRAMVREPGLDTLLEGAGDRLTIADDPAKALGAADVALIAYDTPVNARDELDLTPVDAAVRLVAEHGRPSILLVVHSQVPVGYGRRIASDLAAWQRHDILVTVTPENLRLGQAIAAFRAPGHLAIGGVDDLARDAACVFWGPTGADLVRTDTSTAEMSKHIINATLATATALGNELGEMAAACGADPVGAALLAKKDERLAKLPIVPGLPVGGGTLARDLRLVAATMGTPSLAAAVVDAGDRRLTELLDRLVAAAGPEGVVILGLTYKPGTSATRRSVGVTLARSLAEQGIPVCVFDPDVPAAENPLVGETAITIAGSLSEAIADARTVAITTGHSAWLDVSAIEQIDRDPVVVHDLVGVYSGQQGAFTRALLIGPCSSDACG